MMVEFKVPGKPMAKQRPKVTRSGIAYTPKETRNYENLVKLCYTDQIGHMIEGDAIFASIIAVYPIPKSTSKKKRAQMMDGKIRPTVKPDLDNVAKSILDALNGIAYKDDSNIVRLSVSKWYGDQPRVEVYLQGVKYE